MSSGFLLALTFWSALLLLWTPIPAIVMGFVLLIRWTRSDHPLY
jgi:hypothetical protein